MASSLQDIMAEIRRKAAMQPRLKTETHELAMKGLDYATKISPVGDDEHAGDFRDAWSVVDYPPRFEGDAPVSQLKNNDDGAVSIEYGTHDTPPHHTLMSTKVYMQNLADAREVHL